MSDGNPIAPLGDLGPAAKAFVDRMSDAMGGLARPWQIKRVARAEVEAAKIRAVGEIDEVDLRRRAVRRLLIEEEKSQTNMEGIVQKAIPHIKDNAAPERIDEDWLTAFFRECRGVSNEDMQRLWAHVLAGEANCPNSFSRRTVRLVGDLDRRDAEMFLTLCQFGWQIDTTAYPLVFDLHDQIYNDHGITFDVLNHLDDIGLITFNPVTGFLHQNFVHQKEREMTVLYYEKRFLISDLEHDSDLEVGQALFTQPGAELAKICGTKGLDKFTDYVTDHWLSQGRRIACILIP